MKIIKKKFSQRKKFDILTVTIEYKELDFINREHSKDIMPIKNPKIRYTLFKSKFENHWEINISLILKKKSKIRLPKFDILLAPRSYSNYIEIPLPHIYKQDSFTKKPVLCKGKNLYNINNIKDIDKQFKQIHDEYWGSTFFGPQVRIFLYRIEQLKKSGLIEK